MANEKAQKIRKVRLRSIRKLKLKAEIAYDFILDELDEKTKNKDFMPVKVSLTYNGIPEIGGKQCEEAKIGFEHHWTFLKILEKMFNEEPGFVATIDAKGLPMLYVGIDV